MTKKVGYINQNEQAIGARLSADYLNLHTSKSSHKASKTLKKMIKRQHFEGVAQALRVLQPHYSAFLNLEAEVYDNLSQTYVEVDGRYFCSITLFIPILVTASLDFIDDHLEAGQYINELSEKFADSEDYSQTIRKEIK